MLVTSPVLAASTPTVTAKAPPVVEVAVPAFGRMNWARSRLAGTWPWIEVGGQHAVDQYAIPMSRMAVWPATGTRVGLGSLTVPSNVGRADVVMSSPTMLVSLAGSIVQRAGLDRGRRRVDDERVVEVAARVAVARGQRQLGSGRRCRRRYFRRPEPRPGGW